MCSRHYTDARMASWLPKPYVSKPRFNGANLTIFMLWGVKRWGIEVGFAQMPLKSQQSYSGFALPLLVSDLQAKLSNHCTHLEMLMSNVFCS